MRLTISSNKNLNTNVISYNSVITISNINNKGKMSIDSQHKKIPINFYFCYNINIYILL